MAETGLNTNEIARDKAETSPKSGRNRFGRHFESKSGQADFGLCLGSAPALSMTGLSLILPCQWIKIGSWFLVKTQ